VHEASSSLLVLVTLGVLLGALLYLYGFVRLFREAPQKTSRWRLVCFLGGLFLLWLAVGSPLATLDHQLLSLHMLQHLLLMNVVAPLLLLGAPFVVLLQVLPARLRPGVAGVHLHSAPMRGLYLFLTHPVVCWLAGTTVVIAWHVPAVLALTLRSQGWHLVQHGSFLFCGLLFFWPVVLPWPAVSRWPRWALPLYLFLATLPCDALSAFLVFCGRVVYPHYLLHPSGSSLSPLADQALAGALMWFVVTVGYLLPAVLITLQLLSPKRPPVTAAARV
jgi:putative membrane protein